MNEFCVGCGRTFEADWAFCPACGSGRVLTVPPPEGPAAFGLRAEIVPLVDAGQLNEAETLLRSRLAAARNVETILLLAAVLAKKHHYSEGGRLLEEAVDLDPTNAEAHMGLAEYRGRVGLYDQALRDLLLARRYLPSNEVRGLLQCQELERWLRDKARSSFFVHPSLPSLPGWLRRAKHAKRPEFVEAR